MHTVQHCSLSLPCCALHPVTYLFCNWKFVPFDSLYSKSCFLHWIILLLFHLLIISYSYFLNVIFSSFWIIPCTWEVLFYSVFFFCLLFDCFDLRLSCRRLFQRYEIMLCCLLMVTSWRADWELRHEMWRCWHWVSLWTDSDVSFVGEIPVVSVFRSFSWGSQIPREELYLLPEE